MEIRRGQIWYVKTPCWTGEEMPKNRPGVVVSCNDLNERSGCVLMALLSESEQHIGEPYVATVKSTGVVSTAVCNKLVTVDKTRLGTYMGTVTAQEMRSIEKAIMASLKLKGGKEDCDADRNVEIATLGHEAPPRNDMEWDCHDGPAEEPWGPVGVQGPQGDCGVADTCKHVVELNNMIRIKSEQILARDVEILQLKEKLVRQEALKDAYQWQVQGLLDRMTMRNA